MAKFSGSVWAYHSRGLGFKSKLKTSNFCFLVFVLELILFVKSTKIYKKEATVGPDSKKLS